MNVMVALILLRYWAIEIKSPSSYPIMRALKAADQYTLTSSNKTLLYYKALLPLYKALLTTHQFVDLVLKPGTPLSTAG
jgi:hypothetical protein